MSCKGRELENISVRRLTCIGCWWWCLWIRRRAAGRWRGWPARTAWSAWRPTRWPPRTASRAACPGGGRPPPVRPDPDRPTSSHWNTHSRVTTLIGVVLYGYYSYLYNLLYGDIVSPLGRAIMPSFFFTVYICKCWQRHNNKMIKPIVGDIYIY